MARKTRKQTAKEDKTNPHKIISKKHFRHLLKKQLKKRSEDNLPASTNLLNKLDSLVDEETLTCTICLQLFINPVLAQCGHAFCLGCAQELAKNNFACGICHSHQPTYDLPESKIIEILLMNYLERCSEQEREHYITRRHQFQAKQQNRKIHLFQHKMNIDFWCEEQNIWKEGIVLSHQKNGNLIIQDQKKCNYLQIDARSRRIAPFRYYTKQIPVEPAMNMVENISFHPHSVMNQDRNIFNQYFRMNSLPVVFNLYWPPQNGFDM